MPPPPRVGAMPGGSSTAAGSGVADARRGRIDAARILGKRMDDAAAKCEPPSAEGRRRDRQGPDLVDRRPGPEVSTEENGLHRSGQPAGGGGNIGERPAEVDLLKSRL